MSPRAPIAGAAVVGCGLVGVRRAQALEELGVPVLAVHDPDRARADALASLLHGKTAVVDGAERACVCDGVDLVVIATPHSALVPSALAAIEAGRNVLIEKPGGRSAPELETVADASAARGVACRVGYNHRFHSAVMAAKELVDRGDLGPVLSMRARYGHGGRVGYEHEWRAQREISGGGELLDQGTHLLDLMRFLGGEIELAFCELRTDYWPIEVEDNAYLAVRTREGAFGWLHASWTEWKNTFSLEIALRYGRVDVVGLGGSYGVEQLMVHAMGPEMGPPKTTVTKYDEADASWRHELNDLLAEVEGRPSQGADVRDGIAVLKIVDEAYGQ